MRNIFSVFRTCISARRIYPVTVRKMGEGDPVVSSQIVTPWEVSGEVKDGVVKAINYEKLTATFGCTPISADLIKRIEKLTGKPAHPFIRRGIFFAHRDLEKILDLCEQKKKFYIYTGRGPSSENMHLGHMIPFMFCKYLQEAFDAYLIIQFTDDEKYYFKPKNTIEEISRWVVSNAKDIMSIQFDPEKTFMFTNFKYMNPNFYMTIAQISRMVTISQSKATFGLCDSDSIGKVHFVALESAPAFSSAFPEIFGTNNAVPCLVPAAIDQDPFFRIARDYASRSGNMKPSMVYASFLPSLAGIGHKMSASDDSSCIYLTDSPEVVKKKIMTYAYSGGGDTLAEHRKFGGNPDVDISFQYLRYLLNDDDELEELRRAYRAGEMTTSEMKLKCINEIKTLLDVIQENRRKITDKDLEEFMKPKKFA